MPAGPSARVTIGSAMPIASPTGPPEAPPSVRPTVLAAIAITARPTTPGMIAPLSCHCTFNICPIMPELKMHAAEIRHMMRP